MKQDMLNAEVIDSITIGDILHLNLLRIPHLSTIGEVVNSKYYTYSVTGTLDGSSKTIQYDYPNLAPALSRYEELTNKFNRITTIVDNTIDELMTILPKRRI